MWVQRITHVACLLALFTVTGLAAAECPTAFVGEEQQRSVTECHLQEAELLRGAIEKEPNDVELWVKLGTSLYLAGFTMQDVDLLKQSKQALDSALELDPGHAEGLKARTTTEGWINMLSF